jgi:hypothetical protein
MSGISIIGKGGALVGAARQHAASHEQERRVVPAELARSWDEP